MREAGFPPSTPEEIFGAMCALLGAAVPILGETLDVVTGNAQYWFLHLSL
jgi:hypothetical protein